MRAILSFGSLAWISVGLLAVSRGSQYVGVYLLLAAMCAAGAMAVRR